MNLTPWACTIKRFMAVIVAVSYKLECLPLPLTFTLVYFCRQGLEPIIRVQARKGLLSGKAQLQPKIFYSLVSWCQIHNTLFSL